MEILPVFCDIDDFCLSFEPIWKQQLLVAGERQRNHPSTTKIIQITKVRLRLFTNVKAIHIKQMV
jgi:hypothetical protein